MSVNISVTGVTSTIRGHYTNSLGWLPGIAVIDVLPGSYSGYQIVDIEFTDGANTVTLQDCKVYKVKDIYEINDDGLKGGAVTRLWIKDRRWRWVGLGHVSGTYNIPKNDGTVWSATEKTPQQLISLVLDALGETGYGVTAMPNSHRPFVAWEIAVPAAAGQSLLADCGCDIAYNPLTDTVNVVQLGAGTLPTFSNVQSLTSGFDLADIPSAVIAIADRTTFQCKFALGARGRNRDGSIVAPADLDYTPTLGWDTEDDPLNLLPGQDQTDRALANGSVYRLFQIETFSDGTLSLPGYGTISEIEQVLPLRDVLNESWFTTANQEVDDDPYIEAVYAVPTELIPVENSTSIERAVIPFRVIGESGCIETAVPIYKMNDAEGETGITFPDDLYLTTTCCLRDSNRKSHRYYVQRSISGAPTSPPLVVRVDDIHLQYTAVYDTDGVTVDHVDDNETEVAARLNEAIDAAVTAMVSSAAYVVRMSGIQQIVPSGLIRSVTLRAQIRNGDETNCVWTLAYVNTESEPGMPQSTERSRRISMVDRIRRNRARQVHEYYRNAAKRNRQ